MLTLMYAITQVRLAYNTEAGRIRVENDTLHQFPEEPWGLAWEGELLLDFFIFSNLSYIGHDCNWTWGNLDEDTGIWDGAIGRVSTLSITGSNCQAFRLPTTGQTLV